MMIIVVNNTNYGMTGGQMSPTTMPGQKQKQLLTAEIAMLPENLQKVLKWLQLLLTRINLLLHVLLFQI